MSDAPQQDTRIAIVGVGLIGGSLGLALKRAGHRGPIVGVSRARSLEEARQIGAIDEGQPYERLVDVAARSDVVILAAPISVILDQIDELARAASSLRPGTVITDVGSTKVEILRRASSLPACVHFVGGHPLAGSEHRGVAASDPFLFQNAYYVLTPSPGVPAPVTDRLAALLGRTGASLLILAAEEHDRVAAAISHLPQLLAVSLVRSLRRLGPLEGVATRLAAGGFRDMTRIASSAYSVWRDILDTNRTEIGHALDEFTGLLAGETRPLDDETLATAFADAGQLRGTIPADTKGFLRRLWDVLVEVEDTPATIVRLVTPLADRGINIKDIGVLKVREGEGGTMRLAFDTREVALEALGILTERGWRARIRD